MTDVVIIGAGPAGLTLGCYLAKAGVPCLIVEKAHHPRPHVGESLMPASIRVLREIGFLDVMQDADFPRSGGVVYHGAARKGVAVSYAEFPQDGVSQDHTYHVDRARFDLLLLKHAESMGSRIVEGATVADILFDSSGFASGVRVALGEQMVEIPARLVVDASGRATKLGRQLELRNNHPVLDQFALHAWFVGVDRGRRDTEDHTHIYFLPERRGWAWRAPINDEITSIGVVADKRSYQESGEDVETFFLTSLTGNRALAKATADAEPITDIKGETNYSYRLGKVCGDGWVAIGDAARFIDPVFSSGVSMALHMARSAAERIQSAVESGDFSRGNFQPYEDEVLQSAAIWDDFIRLFYRLLPAFTQLVESPDHRQAILRMIQGDVNSDSEAAVLTELRSIVRSVEEADEHPWKGELLEVPRL